MLAFRAKYPGEANYVVANDVKRRVSQKHRSLRVDFLPLTTLVESLSSDAGATGRTREK